MNRNAGQILQMTAGVTRALASQEKKCVNPQVKLFSQWLLSEFIRERWRRAEDDIAKLPFGALADLSQQAEELYRRHEIAPIVLGEEYQKAADEKEYEADDFGRPANGTAFLLSVAAPFTGEKNLLSCTPNPIQGEPPDVLVGEGELVFQFHNKKDFAAGHVAAIFKQARAQFDMWLTLPNMEAEKYNRGLKAQIPKLLAARKEKLDKNAALMAALPFPLQKIAPPPALELPLERKTIDVPATANKGSQQEHVLAEAHYQDILDTLALMSTVMERSPEAFHNINEESLRFFFLVWLNANYKRQATAETFNVNGKTDILITVEGRTVFIGECKFWDGPKSLTEAIDQILSYLSWRNTKTAILLFVRKANFSEVLEKMVVTVQKHSNCLEPLDLSKETEKSFRFRSERDADRLLTLTVLAFDVPHSTTDKGTKKGKGQ